MKCDNCNKPIPTDYEKGLRDGRNMGLYAGLLMGSLLTASLLAFLSFKW